MFRLITSSRSLNIRRMKSLITGILQYRHDIHRKQGTHNNCSGLLHLNKANRVRASGRERGGITAIFIEICSGISNVMFTRVCYNVLRCPEDVTIMNMKKESKRKNIMYKRDSQSQNNNTTKRYNLWCNINIQVL